MNLKTDIANRRNYGSARSTSKIEWIVLHFTANDGDTDESNGNYFQNNVVKASAHYFVDDDSVTQSVPDNYAAWAVGGKKYSDCSKTGGGKYYGTVTNTNSLSIELCDDVKNGTIYPSEKTIANALELVKMKMKQYNVPADHVIRHFDVNGKRCPAYWCGTSAKNELWKTAFWNKLSSGTETNTSKGGSTVTVTLNVLKNGSKGENVKALQILLNGLGYSCGTADGVFGSKTLTAVKQFQKAKKLTQDGIVGANTWKALLA